LGDGPLRIDSDSTGDPSRFLALNNLATRLATLRFPTKEYGRVVLIVRRAEAGLREAPDQVRLSVDSGLAGDAWARRGRRSVDTQVTVMQHDVAELIANGQPLLLFGDNLFVSLDLSSANLPPESLLRVGAATLAVTARPHTGCDKFRARFGADAIRFVTDPALRHRNLRGIHTHVVEGGDVSVGDAVIVVRRGPVSPPDFTATR
jgi:MOSC domain-containing protein YiiM